MSQSKPHLVEVTLAKPHTHAGQPYRPGDKLTVDAPTRDWLIAHRIVVPHAAKEAK